MVLPELPCSVPSYPLNDAAEAVNEIGSTIRKVGGTSGIMYLTFFSTSLRLDLNAFDD